MKFNPNYTTKDGWFEVRLDKSTLTNEKPEKLVFIQNEEITKCKISVYNTYTEKMSEKSIYYNEKKGFILKAIQATGIKHLILNII